MEAIDYWGLSDFSSFSSRENWCNVSVERIGIIVSVLEQTWLQNGYLRRGRYETLQAGHLEERLCYSQYRYTKAKVHVFYREQRVGDLEYSPHCLQVDPAIHTTITIDNLSVSDQLLIGRLSVLQL